MPEPGADLVSVLVPVYNGEAYLGEAIESVLGQTHRAVELVVVDDGSEDGSAAVARSYGAAVRYSWQANAGTSAAINHAVELSTGDYLTILGADDRCMPEALDRLLGAFARDPELDVVFGHVHEFLDPGLDPEVRDRLRPPADRILGRLPNTMLVTREAFFRIRPFSVDYALGEGLDWFARATEAGLKSTALEEVLWERRLHGRNLGLREAGRATDYPRLLKAALDRRRAAAARAT